MISFFTTIPSFSLAESLKTLWESTGFMTSLTPLWQNLIMLVIAGVLIYLAIAKEFEPNLLVAIGFGMFIINIPGAYQALYGIPMVNEAGEYFARGPANPYSPNKTDSAEYDPAESGYYTNESVSVDGPIQSEPCFYNEDYEDEDDEYYSDFYDVIR